MKIQTAKELKAVQMGYYSWATLIVTYSTYNKSEICAEYEKEAEKWTLAGKIPVDNMRMIEANLHYFREDIVKDIKERLEKCEAISESKVIKETIDFIHKL